MRSYWPFWPIKNYQGDRINCALFPGGEEKIYNSTRNDMRMRMKWALTSFMYEAWGSAKEDLFEKAEDRMRL